MSAVTEFRPGDLVRVRGREWVVLPGTRPDLLRLRPLGGSEEDATVVYVPLEPEPPVPASFGLPVPTPPGPQEAAMHQLTALRLTLRTGAGPLRCCGH